MPGLRGSVDHLRRHLFSALDLQRTGELGRVGTQEEQTADQFGIVLRLDAEWGSQFELDDSGHGPVIQKLSLEAVVPRHRKLPVIVENEALRRIEERQSAAGSVIEGIDVSSKLDAQSNDLLQV